MISKPLTVVLVVKLILMQGSSISLETVFTVNLAMIIINMQVILNGLSYIDMVQVGLNNI